MLLSLSLPNLAKSKFRAKFPNFILWSFEKQIAQCESTTEEVSFEWSHHKISPADLRVEVTLQNAIEHSGSERVKHYVGFIYSLCNHKVSFGVNCNIWL